MKSTITRLILGSIMVLITAFTMAQSTNGFGFTTHKPLRMKAINDSMVYIMDYKSDTLFLSNQNKNEPLSELNIVISSGQSNNVVVFQSNKLALNKDLEIILPVQEVYKSFKNIGFKTSGTNKVTIKANSVSIASFYFVFDEI
jgi:hypothetical protein